MEIKDNDRHKMFTRRAALMGLGGGGIMVTLFGRLYYLQVNESDQYKVMADGNRVSVELVAPHRGRILDRFGTEIASNRSNYRLVLVPGDTPDIEADLDALAKIIDLSDERRRKILKKAKRQKRFSKVNVLEHMNWEDFAKANIHSPDFGGITPEESLTRYYPFGIDLAHIVGYVGPVNEKEIGEDPVLNLPGFRVGKEGIEGRLEMDLRGKEGRRQYEVNAYGKEVRELSRVEQTPGQDAVLTIDTELQSYAMKRLEGQSGAAVVLDIFTGDVLAMASAPGFNPDNFNLGFSQEEWDRVNKDEFKPLTNKAIAGQYPPGSTVKGIVALAALEDKVIFPGEVVMCNGVTRLGNHNFHCWKRGGHGYVNMHSAIKHSCDVYFYDVAQRLGIDRIEAIMRKFGLGGSLDLEIPGEKKGLVPSKGWKIGNTGERWQKGETLIAAIGQGYVTATPMQLAVMTARLANGGYDVKPRFIRSTGNTVYEPRELDPLGVDGRNLRIIQNAMSGVTNERGGTAYGSRIWDKGREMAGKTGTSQVRRITAAERAAGIIKNEDLPWRRRDHALFIAYAPVQAPRYAISVIIEHGGGGSKAAAPVARDIMRRTLIKDPSRRTAIGPIAQKPAGQPNQGES